MAFWPPVSATSAMGRPAGDRRRDSWRAIRRDTSVEPVNITPATSGCATRAAPTVSPAPGTSCSASRGTPASCSRATMAAAVSGVCSAGLASTVLPAARAAATCPQKMASGKFQGLMASTTPSGRCVALSKCAATWAP